MLEAMIGMVVLYLPSGAVAKGLWHWTLGLRGTSSRPGCCVPLCSHSTSVLPGIWIGGGKLSGGMLKKRGVTHYRQSRREGSNTPCHFMFLRLR